MKKIAKKATRKPVRKSNPRKTVVRRSRRNPNDYVPSAQIILKLCRKHDLIVSDSTEHEIVLRTEEEYSAYNYDYYYGVTINVRNGVTMKGFFVVNGNKGYVGHKEELIIDDSSLEKSFDFLIRRIKAYLKDNM